MDGLWPFVDASHFSFGDNFKLALSPDGGFKLGKDAEHLQESAAGRSRRVDGLLCRFEGDALAGNVWNMLMMFLRLGEQRRALAIAVPAAPKSAGRICGRG
jgi:hypothetical protein